MIKAQVLTDFSVNGVTYRKGQVIEISKTQYDQWLGKNWVGPTSDPDRASN